MKKAKIESNGLTFTWNQKCDCYQFNLPPRQSCPGVKERLRDPRSICSYCYAYYGRFGQMASAQKILQKNLRLVTKRTLAELIRDFVIAFGQMKSSQKYFRWFGCGDVLSRKMALLIIEMANIYSGTRFWCPTQTDWFEYGAEGQGLRLWWPKNLIVRRTSGIIGNLAPAGGHATLLPEQKKLRGHFICPGKCDPCRRCWEPWKPETRIAFPFHGSACLMAKFKKARRIHKF